MESKLVTSMEDAKKQKNGIIVDLDKGVELLVQFNKKTISKSKQFKKFAKKFNGADPVLQKKKILKFIKEEIYPIYQKEFLDKFYENKEYEILDIDVLATYTFGSFIEGHATTSKIDIPTQFKLITAELTNRIYAELQKKGKKI